MRLYIIEQELDNVEQNSPFRVSRQKLNREKKRILQRMEGKDPRWFAGVGKGGVPKGEKQDLYRMKKVIITMLDEIGGSKCKKESSI